MDSQKNQTFTKVPNVLLDSMISARLTATQQLVLMLIIRQTYGFHREFAELSTTLISKGTGISKRGVLYAVKQLKEQKILMVQSVAGNSTKQIRINLQTDEWLGFAQSERSVKMKNANGNAECSFVQYEPDCAGNTEQHCAHPLNSIAHSKIKYKENNKYIYYKQKSKTENNRCLNTVKGSNLSSRDAPSFDLALFEQMLADGTA